MMISKYSSNIGKRILNVFRHRFSLIEDKASDEQIDSSIRSGVELRGTYLWLLMFAILIASVGLNVNSTAVIIGAMLISPLMGPIMGIGYGVGIYDSALIKNSLRNLGIATVISLFVSTVYFALTPLSGAQSELLSRTSPTIWDVLVAFFGGLAGIIGATRTEKTNIIPGVAIATALMPPLCTAGYGLANADWEFFFGAFYLYTINCVFIALSTIIIIWVLNPALKQFVDDKKEVKVGRILTLIVLLTLLPSIYLAVKLVNQEVYVSKVKQFLAQEFTIPNLHITTQEIDPSLKKIELTLIGDLLNKAQIQAIESRLSYHNLEGSTLVLHQAKDQGIDVTAIKSNIVSELYKDNLVALENKKKAISILQSKLNIIDENKTKWQDMSAELSAQYPQLNEIYFSEAMQWRKGEGKVRDNLVILNLKSSSKLNEDTKYKIAEWLKIRAKSNNIKVIIE